MPDATIRDVARRAQVSVATGLARAQRPRQCQRADARRGSPTRSGRSATCRMPARAASAWRGPTRSAWCCPISTASSSPRSCAAWTARRAGSGYLLLLSNMHGRREQAALALRAMRGRVDGLIVMAPHLNGRRARRRASVGLPADADQHARRQRRASRRSISTMPRARGRSSTISSRSAASGWSTSPARPETSTRSERAEAFRQAAREHGVDMRGRAAAISRKNRASARSTRCSKRGHEFDAVFAANDNMAIGALQALRARGPASARGRRGRRLRRHSARPAHRPDDRAGAHRRAWRTRARRDCSRSSREDDRGGDELHAPELVVRATTDAEGAQLMQLDRRELLKGSSLLLAGARAPGLRVDRGAAPASHAARLLRRDRAAHLPLVLGHGEPQERAGPRPLADAELLEHRGGRFRASGLCDRRRARLVHAGRSARPDADDAALLLERAAGAASRAARPATRASSTTSSTWRRGCGIATSSCRASTRRSC